MNGLYLKHVLTQKPFGLKAWTSIDSPNFVL